MLPAMLSRTAISSGSSVSASSAFIRGYRASACRVLFALAVRWTLAADLLHETVTGSAIGGVLESRPVGVR